MMNEIGIAITGRAGVGKSRIAALIKETLRKEGFDVELTSRDFEDEEHFDKVTSVNRDEVLDILKKRSKIQLCEVNSSYVLKEFRDLNK